jgi:hypothetical protein
VVYYQDGSTWNESWDAATGTSADYTSASNWYGNWIGGDNKFDIGRGYTVYDTSVLGSGAVVSAGVVSIWITGIENTDNDGKNYIGLIQTSQASPSSLVTADYGDVDIILGAPSLSLNSVSTGAYNTFTLNATGIGWINVTGTTYIGFRDGHDIEDHDIASAPNNNSDWINYWSEQTGTANDPKLVITFTPGSSDTTNALFFGAE